jgi:hypothetical protein
VRRKLAGEVRRAAVHAAREGPLPVLHVCCGIASLSWRESVERRASASPSDSRDITALPRGRLAQARSLVCFQSSRVDCPCIRVS